MGVDLGFCLYWFSSLFNVWRRSRGPHADRERSDCEPIVLRAASQTREVLPGLSSDEDCERGSRSVAVARCEELPGGLLWIG